MRRWWTKVRALLGLGVAGGVGGALLGGLWWLGASVVGMGQIAFGSLLWTVGLWSGFGAFATTSVGVFLAIFGSRLTLQDLSPWRMAAFGAVMGALAPVALVFVLTGGFWVPSLGIIAGGSGLLGGLLGGGLVSTAQRAEAREVEGSEERGALGPAG